MTVTDMVAANIKHGEARRGRKSAEYNIWVMMRQRCQNPKNKRFSLYGGRGITVSSEWSTFSNFLADMGPRPSPSHSLDRIENDKPYSRDNCRWATATMQSRNRRSSRIISISNEEFTLSEACEKFSVDRSVAKRRLSLGWPTVEVFGLSPHKDMRGRKNGDVIDTRTGEIV